MMRGARIWIFFVVFLVVSITPISAVQINNSLNDDISVNITKLQHDSKKVADQSSVLSPTLDHIIKCANEIGNAYDDMTTYWWTWPYFMWIFGKNIYLITVIDIPSVIKNINYMSKDLENLKTFTEGLNKTYSKLNKSSLEISDTNISGNEDAQSIIKEFRTHNISFDIGSASDFKTGDIVQYKSQDKYYRYLQYIKTDKSTNTVQLKGAYNKNMIVPLDQFDTNTQLKLTTKNHINSSQVVNQAYQIQKTQIHQKIKANANEIYDTNTTINHSNDGLLAGSIILGVGLTMIVVDLAVFLYVDRGDVDSLAPEFQHIMICSSIAIAAGLLILGVCAKINTNYTDILKDLNRYHDDLTDELSDLNLWASNDNASAPVAGGLNFTTHDGGVLNGVLNGSDVYDNLLSYRVVDGVENGVLSVDSNGGFVYKPKPGFVGEDTFNYRVHDEDLNLDSNVASVTINVQPDQAPVVEDKTFYMTLDSVFNGFLNATDPDGDNVAFSVVTEPVHGTLTLTYDGKFVYTPNANYTGEDSFTYIANDGILDSNTGKVTLNIVSNVTLVAKDMILNIAQDTI
jgi:VCBS repeat-containing protein